MPFEERSIVSQREEFCRLALRPGANLSELCRRFGIGRTAAYKWVGRYRSAGVDGLADRSRRPHASPRRSEAELEGRVLAVRAEHPVWGGRKIHRVLKNQGLAPPAASTITEILRRHDVLDGPGSGEAAAWTRFEHAAPNDLWQVDFKGWFSLPAGRCHPLTVLDDHSRYNLTISACGDEQDQTVRACLGKVFRRHGLPWRILCDNGQPWGAAGNGDYTKLAVWLLDLGIAVSHGKPYHPQTQGKDERFHRTLKAEVIQGRAFRDLPHAQAAFDAWRDIYNTKRPHEGIGMQTPSQRYVMSQRPMPDTIPLPEYGCAATVRTIDTNGRFSFRGHPLRWSKAFAGKRIALRPTDHDGLFNLCYRSHLLAQVDLRQNTVQPVRHVSEHLLPMSPV
jgi:transposase InsO family protein